MDDLEKRIAALETRVDRLEPHVNRSIPLGPRPKSEEEIVRDAKDLADELLKAVKKEVPPVDRSQMQLAGGRPVPADHSHTRLKGNGQQQDYVVLTREERAKGFVRPVRQSYVHVGKDPVMEGIVLIRAGKSGCGTRTTMNRTIAETYARDPAFYSGTFCATCGTHRPLEEFVWEGTTERVGS